LFVAQRKSRQKSRHFSPEFRETAAREVVEKSRPVQGPGKVGFSR
jgi:transposase-like protein